MTDAIREQMEAKLRRENIRYWLQHNRVDPERYARLMAQPEPSVEEVKAAVLMAEVGR